MAAYIDRSEEEAEAQWDFLGRYEQKLCELQENVLLTHFIVGVLQFCSNLQGQAIQRKIDTGNSLWFPLWYLEMTDALVKKDKRKAQYLLDSDYNALLSGVRNQ